MKFIILIAWMLMGFGLMPHAWSCEPCALYDLKKTIKLADLIVVGKKSENQDGLTQTGAADKPDVVRVRVIMSLKSKAPAGELVVNSYDGECPNGMVVDATHYYVMFLEKQGNEYDSVQRGCGIKTLVYENASVIVDGKPMVLDDFEAYVRANQ